MWVSNQEKGDNIEKFIQELHNLSMGNFQTYQYGRWLINQKLLYKLMGNLRFPFDEMIITDEKKNQTYPNNLTER